MNAVSIAIVGLNFGGYIVGEVLRDSNRKHVTLAAVCDLDAAKAAETAKRHGVRGARDLDDLLADPRIEAIGLYTGPVGRADLIRKIIRAGKHVMTTKPFELDPGAAADVLEEAARLKKVVHLNSPAPELPKDLKLVKSWEKKHSLGRPIACRRDVWASYREQADGSWYDDPDRCPAAPIFRLGIYLINDMVRLFGDAESVQIMQSRLFTGRPTPDNAQLGILFRNGVIGNIFASFCVDDGQQYLNTMTLNYERGTVYRNTGANPDGRDRPLMSMIARTAQNATVTEQAQLQPHESSGQYQWDNFQKAIRGQKLADEVKPAEIVAGIKIITAMAKAQKSGESVRIN